VHTFRADIDYGSPEAPDQYGVMASRLDLPGRVFAQPEPRPEAETKPSHAPTTAAAPARGECR